MFIKYLRNTSFCRSDKMKMNFQLIKLLVLVPFVFSSHLLVSLFPLLVSDDNDNVDISFRHLKRLSRSSFLNLESRMCHEIKRSQLYIQLNNCNDYDKISLFFTFSLRMIFDSNNYTSDFVK
jgi:hypothetical protein